MEESQISRETFDQMWFKPGWKRCGTIIEEAKEEAVDEMAWVMRGLENLVSHTLALSLWDQETEDGSGCISPPPPIGSLSIEFGSDG
jgi:hypothetical protein